MSQTAVIVVVVALALLFFAAPALIAFVRKHPERATILRLSGFALFSFILWGALLTWALSDKRDDGVIAQYVARLRSRNLLPYIVGGLVLVGAVGSAVAFLG